MVKKSDGKSKSQKKDNDAAIAKKKDNDAKEKDNDAAIAKEKRDVDRKKPSEEDRDSAKCSDTWFALVQVLAVRLTGH